MNYPVYAILETKIVPLFISSHSDTEFRYLELFKTLDLSKGFYYSYTYALYNTVQSNFSVQIDENEYGVSIGTKYIYNQYHLDTSYSISRRLYDLVLHVVHGFLSVTPISFSGRIIELYLISRRSRHYAGTRYRKRGINNEGHVANEVQTEIVVYDSTHSRSIMSFVQLRGSIPLFWTQKLPVSILKKPPILYEVNDGTLSSTRRHFNYLFAEYGAPVICLNLLSEDLETEEGILSLKYINAIEEINRLLPKSMHVEYMHRDLRNYQLLGNCEQIMSATATECVDRNGFFHFLNGEVRRIQFGVIRSSCLDCLDRTNTMMQRTALVAIAKMLHAMNVISSPDLSNDPTVTEAIKTNINLMGDRLSLQYGGSRVLKKYESGQSMVNQSAQLLTLFERRYKNSFGDADKQVAINLFLGKLKPDVHPPPWEQDLDIVLHTKHMDDFCGIDWFVMSLQYFYNKFRTLSPCSSSTCLKPCSTAFYPSWCNYYSGDPQACPFKTKITYIPWWAQKANKSPGGLSDVFIEGGWSIDYFFTKLESEASSAGEGKRLSELEMRLPALSKYISDSDIKDTEYNYGFDECVEYDDGYVYRPLKCSGWDESNYENLFNRQLKFYYVKKYAGLYKL